MTLVAPPARNGLWAGSTSVNLRFSNADVPKDAAETRLGLHVLHAFLWIGVIWSGLVILSAMIDLHETLRIDYADQGPEVFTILVLGLVFVGLATSFLFGIGALRAHKTRLREAEQRDEDLGRPETT